MHRAKIMTQVKGKFDFQAEGPDELSFSVGEILTVLDTTIGGGWWKAQNSAGQEGYIPADFVETLEIESIPEPAFAPPPLPASEVTADSSAEQNQNYSSWYSQPSQPSSYSPSDPTDVWSTYPANSNHADAAPLTANVSAPQTSGWDSDEFDDDDYGSETAASSTSSSLYRSQSQTVSERQVPTSSTSEAPNRQAHTKTVASSSGVFMKLSDYSKTGVGAFILGQMKNAHPPPSDCNQLYISEGVVQWRPKGMLMEFDILPDHKVGGKLAGLKKFVEYRIAKRDNSVEVSRRYKQFDWFHEQLSNKFAVIAVPPLPHKQITGRYEEEFIEVRKRGLRAWLNRISRHPVISHSSVFQHFVTCTDTKDKWKQGKRLAEKDDWQGGKWMLGIEAPPASELANINDREEVKQFEEYSDALSTAVRSMIDTQQLYSKKLSCVYKRDYQKIASSFAEFGQAFQKGSTPGLRSLARSAGQTSGVFEDISKLFGDQPDLDSLPFIDALHEYKGMLSDGLPDIFGLSRGAAASVADVEKQASESKVSNEEIEACRARQRLLNLVILAERTHLSQQQEADFEQMFCQFIRAQIMFYSNVTRKLEEGLRLFSSSQH